MTTKTITLDPGIQSRVDFTFTPTVAKVHQVSVDGLSGSFSCSEVPYINPEIFHFTEIVENHLPESIIGWAEATCPGQGLPRFQYVPPSGYEVVRCVLTSKLGTHGGCPNCIMSEIWCERIS